MYYTKFNLENQGYSEKIFVRSNSILDSRYSPYGTPYGGCSNSGLCLFMLFRGEIRKISHKKRCDPIIPHNLLA